MSAEAHSSYCGLAPGCCELQICSSTCELVRPNQACLRCQGWAKNVILQRVLAAESQQAKAEVPPEADPAGFSLAWGFPDQHVHQAKAGMSGSELLSPASPLRTPVFFGTGGKLEPLQTGVLTAVGRGLMSASTWAAVIQTTVTSLPCQTRSPYLVDSEECNTLAAKHSRVSGNPRAHPVKDVPILCVVHVEEVGALPFPAPAAVTVPSPLIPLPVGAAASLPAVR